jgi:peptidoglycan hydrolase-like protein with peptidoglycan-binding domain
VTVLRRGYDWSGDTPSVNSLRAGGASFVGRYSVADHPRGISGGELQMFTAAGMDIITFWESNAGWMLGGYPAGVAAAQDHQRNVRACGQAAPVPMFAADDVDTMWGQLDTIAACLDGVASVLGRDCTGIYGEGLVVDQMLARGKAKYGCQALAWAYESPGLGWSARAQVHQDGYNLYPGGTGTQCDGLTAVADDFGQWRRPSAPPADVQLVNPFDPHLFEHNHLLRGGDSGAEVVTAQTILNVFYPLTIDGQFGTEMYMYLQDFQRKHRIPASGAVGGATWKAFAQVDRLVHRYDWYGAPGNPTALTYLSHGDAVKAWQTSLNAVGVAPFTPIPVDSYMGPKTLQATKKYQQNRQLPVGTVTQQVWRDMARLMTRYGH